MFVVWVCTRDSTFLHSTFNFDLCNIQVFAFDIQLFISSSRTSFPIRPSSSVEWTFTFSYPTFSISFPPKFNVPFYIVLCIIYPTFCVCHLSLHSRLYGVSFPPKFNVPFYIVLCIIYPTFCVCHLSLHSRLYGVSFPPKFNVPFYIVLCIIYPTFCVCHLSLLSRLYGVSSPPKIQRSLFVSNI